MDFTRTHLNAWFVHYLTAKRGITRLYYTGTDYQDVLTQFESHLNTDTFAVLKITRRYEDRSPENQLIETGESIVLDMLISGDPDNTQAYQEIMAAIDLSNRVREGIAAAAAGVEPLLLNEDEMNPQTPQIEIAERALEAQRKMTLAIEGE